MIEQLIIALRFPSDLAFSRFIPIMQIRVILGKAMYSEIIDQHATFVLSRYTISGKDVIKG